MTGAHKSGTMWLCFWFRCIYLWEKQENRWSLLFEDNYFSGTVKFSKHVDVLKRFVGLISWIQRSGSGSKRILLRWGKPGLVKPLNWLKKIPWSCSTWCFSSTVFRYLHTACFLSLVFMQHQKMGLLNINGWRDTYKSNKFENYQLGKKKKFYFCRKHHSISADEVNWQLWWKSSRILNNGTQVIVPVQTRSRETGVILALGSCC